MKRIDRRIVSVLKASGGQAYVLDIIKDGGFTQMGAGRIYASLDRMMARGLVSSYVNAFDGRTVYQLGSRVP